MAAKIIIRNPGTQEINLLSPLELCKAMNYQDHYLFPEFLASL